MKKRVLAIAASGALLLTVSVWAEDSLAVVREVQGRVEFKVPGGEWMPATAGVTLAKDTIVSTGFNSQALIALGESILTIKPITRLTLEDILRQEGGESVKLYLLAGRVRAEVHPPVGGTTDFKIRSPTATASVRGTQFEFDSVSLDVADGVVSFSGTSGGPAVQVTRGESSFVDENGSATVAVSESVAAAAPPPAPVGVDADFLAATLPGSAVQTIASGLAQVEISVGW